MASRNSSLRKSSRLKVLKKTNGECCYCNSILDENNFTVEHIFDSSTIRNLFLINLKKIKRGKNTLACLPCCACCNTKRSDHKNSYYTPMGFAMLNNSNHLDKIMKIWSINICSIYPAIKRNLKNKKKKVNSPFVLKTASNSKGLVFLI